MPKKTPSEGKKPAQDDRPAAQAERADSAAPAAAGHSDAGGARATPSAAKTVQPPVADGYYFKRADGRVAGPITADKFEW
jgi:hypothetical protein